MNLDDIFTQNASSRRGESILIYGLPKTGKTRLAGQIAKTHKVLWFDLENGIRTLLSETALPAQARKNIEVISLPDTKSNPVAIDTLLRVFSGQPCKICDMHGKVSCLICAKEAEKPDSSTTFSSVELGKLSSDTVVVVDSASQLSDSSYAKVKGVDVAAQLDWRDYDRWNQLLAMILSQVQQASYNSIFIAHARIVEMPDGAKKLCPTIGTQAFSSNVAKFFGSVLYTEIKGMKFCVGSQHDYAPNLVVGNRAGIKLDETKHSLSGLLSTHMPK